MTETKKLGKYIIIEEIGRGGFSVVYKALDTSLENRPVALKVLHPHLLVDPTFVQRLQHEAGAAANLSHSNIVVVHEVGEIDGTYFIAMKYLPGTSLDELIKEQGPLAPPRAVKIISQIASALDYAHEKGFIHRDVKSGNIIVGEDDHATLTDFGLVRAAEGTSLTSTGKILGTPEYMSPEQADPLKSRQLDWRTDLYSLGIVAFELLTGHVPFKGDTPTATHYMHVHEKPPKPTLMNPDLPKKMEAPVLKALAKERSDRYQTGKGLAQALAKRIAEEEPGNRRKWLAAGAAAAGIMLIALIIWGAGFLPWLPGGTPAVPPTSTPTEAIVPMPTRTHAPTASPTETPAPTPTSTTHPTSTSTVTPSPTPEPTNTPTKTVQTTSTLAPPTATGTSSQAVVSECPADMACLKVLNHCGEQLILRIRQASTEQEILVKPQSETTIPLEPGTYSYEATTVMWARPARSDEPGLRIMELRAYGNIILEAGDVHVLAFTVACQYWDDAGKCAGPELVHPR